MRTKLLPHQQAFVDKNPDKHLLAWGTRVGKSLAITGWIEKQKSLRCVLICPKRLKKQWQDALTYEGIKNTDVYTKEEILRVNMSVYDAVVVDEAHHATSPLLKPSRITRLLHDFTVDTPTAPILLATATPIRSTPWNIHTLAWILGTRWNSKEFQKKFFNLVKRPYSPRPFWEPVKQWRTDIHPFVHALGDVLTLADIVEVPEQRHHVIDVPLTEKTQRAIKEVADVNATAEWYARHKLAQREEKLEKIRELSDGEAKVIIVAKYIEQIEYYAQELEGEREVIVLTGKTKDQAETIKRAQESLECYFIIQADAGEGFRGDSFSMMIFASMSWSFLAYDQMLGRMMHLDKKHSNDYYFLLSTNHASPANPSKNEINKSKDRHIYERVMSGRDFSLTEIAKSAKEN